MYLTFHTSYESFTYEMHLKLWNYFIAHRTVLLPGNKGIIFEASGFVFV